MKEVMRMLMVRGYREVKGYSKRCVKDVIWKRKGCGFIRM